MSTQGGLVYIVTFLHAQIIHISQISFDLPVSKARWDSAFWRVNKKKNTESYRARFLVLLGEIS